MKAVANLDQSLLADDAVLYDAHHRLMHGASTGASQVGHDAVDELGTVAQAWLGSTVCARHIGRHLRRITGNPTFWTREQRGDEASTWLFFTHKHRYLHRTVEAFGCGDADLSRTFCIPEHVVAEAAPTDRVLLFLAFALMEATGVRAVLCSDPAYTDVEGFVLSARKAVIANWVRGEGLWHVDVTANRAAVTDFDTVVHGAGTGNVLDETTSCRRLQALAEYLHLDWPWLVRRSRELSAHGCAGLVNPRSRLLGLDGLEQAVDHIGGLAA